MSTARYMGGLQVVNLDSKTMKCPRAALFDLDDTLAESFQPPSSDMIEKLRALLEHIPVVIITAAGFKRIQREFFEHLADSPHISRLTVFPNSAAQCYRYTDGAWNLEYNLALSKEDRERIKTAVDEAVVETGIIEPSEYVPAILDREVQIAFAALGLKAPLPAKEAWDPDQSKRKKLKALLEQRIPEFEILIGGMTTIDITTKGVNKAYGVNYFAKRLGAKPSEMLYVGDALYEGGNDYVVIPTGIQTRSVTGPADTLKVIDELLQVCSAY